MNWMNNKTIGPLSLAVAAFAMSALAQAAESKPGKPDLAKGSAIASSVCAACHGADGNSTAPANPKLAGQHADYLVKQLNNFKPQTGATAAARANAIMAGFVGTMSEEDMRNVAAHFAKQAAKPGTAKASKDSVALGEKLYRGGMAEKGLPACAGCHGPTGAGIPAQYPKIGGQWAEYTATQLTAFRDGGRKNSLQMSQLAAKMSDAEIKAVSDYIAGLR